MFDKNDKKIIKRLKDCIATSDRKLEKFRENRKACVQQFVGHLYGENGAPDKVPVNLMELFINTFMRATVARPPQVLITSDKSPLEAQAANLEAIVNNEITDMYLHDELVAGGLDAMFGVGVIKVGEADDESDPQREAGEIYANAIDLDDLIIDMSGKRRRRIKYIGHKYRVPHDEFMESDLYSDEHKEVIKAKSRQPVKNGEEITEISSGSITDEDEYFDEVELICLYLPREQVEVTLSDDIPDEALDSKPWKGPSCGPYHILGFTDVPGQVMPLCPASVVMDLHDPVNRMARKIIRQADRQKENTGYRGTSAVDFGRLQGARDGDGIRMDDPDGMKVFKSGGADPASFALFLQLKDTADFMNGNISAVAGLGNSAPTATQDQLITAAASKRIQDMQERVYLWTKGIIKSIAWWIFHDPTKKYTAYREVKEIPGFRVTANYSKAKRKGEFFEHNFDIDPFSMRGRSPEERLQFLIQYIQGVVMPMSQAGAQQGGTVDMAYLNDLVSKYSNLPEIKNIWKFGAAPSQPEEGSGERPLQSPVTSRTNVRENRSIASRQGGSNQTIQKLLAQAGGAPGLMAG